MTHQWAGLSHGHSPSGGCSMSPFLSQVPMGWMSEESTNLQKSLVLSLPSRRRRRRVPIMPITVAMHTELELRGSRASSFIPALKSLVGGTLDCTHPHTKGRLITVMQFEWKAQQQNKVTKVTKHTELQPL